MKKSTLLPVCLVAVLFLTMIACGLTPASKGPATTEATQAQAATSTPAQSPTPRPTATPAEPTSTPTPRPTATPAEPTSTPTPVPPTDTPEPQAAPELGEGLTCSQVFSEDFTHPSPDWPNASDTHSRLMPTEGEYQILIQEANYFYYSPNNALYAADFVLEMDAHYASQNFGAYGLVFGLDSLDNGQNFYAFVVDPQQYFGLFKHTEDQWTPIVDWTESPALNAGQEVNRLRVERRDDAISLAANDQPLIATHDDTFTGPGYIALITEAFDVGDVDARFDNIIACLSPTTWPEATATPVPQPTATPAPRPTPTPPPAAPGIPEGKGALIMLNCRGDVIDVDIIPVAMFQQLAPKTGEDCKPGEPIYLDPGTYTLSASIAGVPSKGQATITIEAGRVLRFTWY